MSRTLSFVLLYVLLAALVVSSQGQQVISVPLEYNYLPGEPFWAKYGSIDQRSIELWIGPSRQKDLGCVMIDNSDLYKLVPGGNIQDYLDKAVSAVLSHYGVIVQQHSEYRLVVTPLLIAIAARDNEEDGDKLCTIKLRADFFGPDTTQLFSALITNEGEMEVDDDDDLAYADLIDRTLHGAIVKIWGSRVLYTDRPLGAGTIKKIDRGTYVLIPDSTLQSPADNPACRVSRFQRSAATVSSGVNPPDTDFGETGGTVITGATGIDTVVVAKGRRISVGILPFENSTGNDQLTALVKSAQEHFTATLSRSTTIKIMERNRLADILKEQALGLSGIMNDSTVVKVGNISGLQVMIAGSITTSGSYYRIGARIINVETSAIVASASLLISDALQISEAGTELAAQLLYKFTEEKLEINRNTMAYPSIAPRAIPAVAASTEDAWAVVCNPASIMKVSQRDAAFHITFAEKLSGKTPDGSEVSSGLPPYAFLGLNFVYPVNGFFGTGLGINHYNAYPKIEDKTAAGSYTFREEATAFTIPVAFGVTPKLSFGASATARIAEYVSSSPGNSVEGSAITTDLKLGALFKLSERFRMGATYQSPDLYDKTEEIAGGVAASVERPSAHDFRIGTAMYPVRWFFFFADLEYQKYETVAQAHPGFHLGMQFTAYGRPKFLDFLPQYGMLPLYIGYSHEPYDRIKNTQTKYLSIGSGYYLNNIYVQWAWRKNIEGKADRTISLGSGDYRLRLQEYAYTAPFFLCVGYRF
jgi:TolB-like protein